MTRTNYLFLFLSLLIFIQPAAADEKTGPPVELKHLKYRLLGPNAGGRVCRAAGIPGDPRTYYLASASGGVWKSTDGGHKWQPIFDDQPTATAGSIAIAPSEPSVIYVGSGEANLRGNVAQGNGIYRSTDGGKTWQHVWKQAGQVGQIIVHPLKADVAFAAVLGKPFGPNPERGVYRTTDGGKSWQQVLKKDADTGAIDVCFDPNNPRVLFAALWQVRRTPWSLSSGGPGSGLYRSTDGGDTWERLGPQGEPAASPVGGKPQATASQDTGLPDGPWGRVGIAVAPSDSRRVYALIEAKEKGGLYRSDDGGDRWEWVGKDRALQQRPWYFSTIHVDPANKDVVWCPTVRLLKSIDGGRSWKQVKGPHHVDHHDLWFDPKDPRRIIDSNDGGVDISLNGGETWFAPLLPLSQFYHISADNRTPYHVLGNIQDIGTAAGPSNSLSSEGIAQRHWYTVGGGETGVAIADPKDPDTVYAGEYGGYLSRFDRRTKQTHDISPFPYNLSGKAASEVKYRFNWTAPTLVSQHDSRTIYHGANVLFRSRDRDDSWEVISPDLTRNDRSKQQFSGGPITGDNVGTEYYCTLFTLAESPRKQGLLWAGSDDGLVQVSSDGGRNWINVAANIPDLPAWSTISCIEPSPFDEQIAYVVADGHRLDDVRPHCWKTTDLGKTWQKISGKLSQDVYLHVLRADPKVKGLLYLGTELGVQISFDDGLTWEPLKLNLPTVAVHDLVVKDDDLVVGTHGRSIWIFDDLTPVRRLPELRRQREKVQLLPVNPAIRWRYHSPVYSTGDQTAHDNPPEGAILHYHLPKELKSELRLEILDREGKVIRTLSHEDIDNPPKDGADPDPRDESPELVRKPGLHRVVWDLRHQGARRLSGAKLDAGNPLQGPLVLPGLYRVRLHWGVKESADTTIEVRQDPRVSIKESDLVASLQLALRMRDDINRLVDTVEGIRLVRGQLERRNELLKKKADAAQLIKQSELLLQNLEKLEEQLHNPRAKVVYEILAQRGGAKLYSQLTPLYSSLLESDGPPGQGLRQLYAEHTAELQRLGQQWRELLQRELVGLNELARQLGLSGVLGP